MIDRDETTGERTRRDVAARLFYILGTLPEGGFTFPDGEKWPTGKEAAEIAENGTHDL